MPQREVGRSHFVEAVGRMRIASRAKSAPFKRILRNQGIDAQDVEQDALLRVWMALGVFDPKRASFRTFFERVIVAEVLCLVRKATAYKRQVRSAGETWTPSSVDQVDIRLDVQRRLLQLHRKDQRIAAMLTMNSPSEVSRALGIPRSAVYKSIDRIRFVLEDLKPGRTNYRGHFSSGAHI